MRIQIYTSFLAGLETIDCLGELNDDQQECLDISIDGGKTLLGMINDLLDISKMEAGALGLDQKPTKVQELDQQSLEQVASLAKAKGLKLVTEVADDLPVLHGDSEKLSRTLVNLMGNAIKFTPVGGTITLSTAFVPRPGRTDSFVFCVSDDGEGIPPEAFNRIFEKFGQVENRRAGRMASTGLGLTFCKMVVEAHGGRIWIESTPGEGSHFFFAIPVRGAKA